MDISVFRPTTKQQLGPFGLETVRGMLARGELSKDDLIYHAGLKEWASISALPVTPVTPPVAMTPVVHATPPIAPTPVSLEERVAALEQRLGRSSLHSPKFWSRAFAVLGHNFSAVLAIYAVVFVIALIVMLIAAMVGGLTK
jgi:hypothetical protein